ncbi:MAG: voltage-gated chloride channel protein [Verrucomicrobia bacterium]|nr:MAG: voltage-gated chloride channel protein [Verrucomicrobiota bacterium]
MNTGFRKKHALQGAYRMFLCLVGVGAVTGSLVALFLHGLDIATEVHRETPWLLWLLPLAGVAMVHVYQRYGGAARQGSFLLVEEMQHGTGRVPRRMAPLILLSTWLTHLFGGSAGREGTAVQMGASVSAWAWRWGGLSKSASRSLMMAGMSAGFGAVFGTPWAGAIFSLELPVRGRCEWRSFLPCAMASWVGHVTSMAWGVQHSDFGSLVPKENWVCGMTPWMFAFLLIAALAFGACGRFFVTLSEWASRGWSRWIPQVLWRPVIGAGLIILLVECCAMRDYLGLGVEASRVGGVSLLSSFELGGAEWWSWLAKLILTVITLSCGFRGGEVTPLFFIGAALGNALAMLTGQSVEIFAALGLVAVFASASNAPMACVLMGCELFGWQQWPALSMVCLIAYVVSGKAGIYHRTT